MLLLCLHIRCTPDTHTSHECHGFSNHRQLHCLYTACSGKQQRIHTSSTLLVLWESTDDRSISLTKVSRYNAERVSMPWRHLDRGDCMALVQYPIRRKISQTLEAARFVFRIVGSLRNLIGTPAALLRYYDFKLPILWLRDFTKSYDQLACGNLTTANVNSMN